MLLCTVRAASLACCCATCSEHGLDTEQVLPDPEGEAVNVDDAAWADEAAATGPTRNPAAIAAAAANARAGLEVRMVSLPRRHWSRWGDSVVRDGLLSEAVGARSFLRPHRGRCR